jgi:hypothetical protein
MAARVSRTDNERRIVDVGTARGRGVNEEPSSSTEVRWRGLRLEALYGGFAGEPLDDNSHEYVFVARR